MSHLSGRALVLGSDTRSFLSVVRSLGRAGIEVHVAWCPADAPALASRYVHTVHLLPPFDVEPLCGLLREVRFDLVIPCDDFAILPLQFNRHSLPPDTRVYLLDDHAFSICSDKAKTYELARELGIPLAQQGMVSSLDELDAAAAAFGWPLVLKPASSVTASDPGARNAVRKAWNRDQARALAKPPLLVQQNFIGIGMGVEVLCHEGEVLTAFQHERVHEPLPGGGSTYRKSIALWPELFDAARKLMARMRYTGVGMVEFKINPKTGAWILIEINGRFWGSLPLSVAAGADFPRYLFEMLVLGRRSFPQTYRSGVYGRNWMLDLRWMARNLLADRGDPTLMSKPLLRVLCEFKNLPREHSDTLTADDPRPAGREVRQAAAKAIGPLLHLLRKRSMAARTSAALRGGRHILVLCKGNICRSPFAAAYIRKLTGPGVEVESAGHYWKAGRESPIEAVLAAHHFGVDIGAHRSRILSEDMVRRADVILIFEPDQEQAVREWFPYGADKLHYLGALRRDGGIRIRDPWGSDENEFLNVYQEIQQSIERAFGAPPAVYADAGLNTRSPSACFKSSMP